MTITDWQRVCHETAVDKGWWDAPSKEAKEVSRKLAEIAVEHANLSFRLEALRRGESFNPGNLRHSELTVARLTLERQDDLAKMALIHSEVTEAVECILGGRIRHYPPVKATVKPTGAVVELADVVIRILDWCGRKKLDLETALGDKHTYNTTRPYRHGGKLG